jgi:hypothetical protein
LAGVYGSTLPLSYADFLEVFSFLKPPGPVETRTRIPLPLTQDRYERSVSCPNRFTPGEIFPLGKRLEPVETLWRIDTAVALVDQQRKIRRTSCLFHTFNLLQKMATTFISRKLGQSKAFEKNLCVLTS